MGVTIDSLDVGGDLSGNIVGRDLNIRGRAEYPMPQYADAWSTAKKMAKTPAQTRVLEELCMAIQHNREEEAEKLTDKLAALAPDILQFLGSVLPAIFVAATTGGG